MTGQRGRSHDAEQRRRAQQRARRHRREVRQFARRQRKHHWPLLFRWLAGRGGQRG